MASECRRRAARCSSLAAPPPPAPRVPPSPRGGGGGGGEGLCDNDGPSPFAVLEAAFDKLGEGAGAVTDPMFLCRLDFAEGRLPALGHEHRVVAEAALAARRPDQGSCDLAAEQVEIAVAPGERQHRDEEGAAVLLAEFAMHALHRDAKILGRAGPARGIDPRRAAQSRDDET